MASNSAPNRWPERSRVSGALAWPEYAAPPSRSPSRDRSRGRRVLELMPAEPDQVHRSGRVIEDVATEVAVPQRRLSRLVNNRSFAPLPLMATASFSRRKPTAVATGLSVAADGAALAASTLASKVLTDEVKAVTWHSYC